MNIVPTCPYCDTKIPNKRVNQFTCGARSCKSKREIENNRSDWYGKIIKCKVCKKEVKKKQYNQAICGSSSCKTAMYGEKKKAASDVDSVDARFANLFLMMPPLLPRDMYI